MGTLRRNMAKKSTGRKAAKRSALDKKVGTTAGATSRQFEVAQVGPDGIPVQRTQIQLDRCLSLVNRRLYRQQKVYRAKISLSPNVDQTPLRVYALRNTWAVRKAAALAKEIYDMAVKEERAVVGAARWHDFRISTIDNGWGGVAGFPLAVSGASKNPLGYGGTLTDPNGEYLFSKIEAVNTAGVDETKFFSLLNLSNAAQYSIFDEYNKMGRETTRDPISASDGGYDGATGDSFQSENVEYLLSEGNLPPYDAKSLNLTPNELGGAWVEVGTIGRLANGTSRTSTDFFDAPLGIIVVDGGAVGPVIPYEGEADVESSFLHVTLQEGDYKGVAATDI